MPMLWRRSRSAAVPANIAGVVRAARQLRPDQRAAFDHAIGPERLELIEGRAGTGKSYTLRRSATRTTWPGGG